MSSDSVEIEKPIKVSVVLCTLNRQAIVRNTIKKLASQTYSNSEFLILDQTAARDPALENTVNELGAAFRYIRLPKPNLPAARNEGVRNTSGEIILFIDDDVDPDNDLVPCMCVHIANPRMSVPSPDFSSIRIALWKILWSGAEKPSMCQALVTDASSMSHGPWAATCPTLGQH